MKGKGQVAESLVAANERYPKVIRYTDNRDDYTIIETSDDLPGSLAANEQLVEPINAGWGTTFKILYTPTLDGALLFEYVVTTTTTAAPTTTVAP